MSNGSLYRTALKAAQAELADLTPKKEKPVKARKEKKAKAAKPGKHALAYDAQQDTKEVTAYVATHRAPTAEWLDSAGKSLAEEGVVLAGKAREHVKLTWLDSHETESEWEAYVDHLRWLNCEDGFAPDPLDEVAETLLDVLEQAAIDEGLAAVAREATPEPAPIAVALDLDGPAVRAQRIVLIDEHGESLAWKVDEKVLYAVMSTLADNGEPEDL